MNKKTIIKLAAICICGAVLFASVAFLLSRNSNEDITPPQPTKGSSYITDNGDILAPEGFDLLPDSYVGSWAVRAESHILQSPRNPQITEEEAFSDELNSYIILAYANYRTSRTSEISSPLYKVTKSTDLSIFNSEGIQSDGITAEFGENLSITKIEVFNNDGITIADTIFVINDSALVYYGSGSYVFAAYKVEALG